MHCLLDTVPGRYTVIEVFFFVIPKLSYYKDNLIHKRLLVSQVKVSFKLRLNDIQCHEDGCKAGTPKLLLFPSKE